MRLTYRSSRSIRRAGRDLDQAVHIAAAGDGYLVSYAIADVAAFVQAGSELDAESRRRGQTFYFPDLRVPQLPPLLSEGAASLLPGQVRPAVLWQISLDAHGTPQHVDLRRARVRSTAQLDYVGVQRALESGSLPPALALLEQVGRKRQALARARHAINLDLPEQEVEIDGSAPLADDTRPAAGRALQRRDLPAHRHVRRAVDARRIASGCCEPCPIRSPARSRRYATSR